MLRKMRREDGEDKKEDKKEDKEERIGRIRKI